MKQPSLFDTEISPARAGAVQAAFAEPHTLPRGFAGYPVRHSIAAGLEEVAADLAAKRATDDEMLRFLRGSLYVLTNAEMLRVAAGLVLLLRADREQVPV